MEFRLAYDGILLPTTAGCARVNIKHAIRKEIQKQLRTLWSIQPWLLELATHKIILEDPLTGEPHVRTMLDQIVAKYKRFGFNFAPLVRRTFGQVCDLEIQFSCHKAPKIAAAKDRELKDWTNLLFEALRLPRYVRELPLGAVPDADEMDYFFCLLEYADLIRGYTVTRNRLLPPLKCGDSLDHVYVIIKVKTGIVDYTKLYAEFPSR